MENNLDRRNLLIIITDQERRTQHFPDNWEKDNLPNMTLLKNYGITFNQAQCNSCMCTPSRSVLFTGKYASETGMTATLSWGGPQSPGEVQLDPTIPNLATMLNKEYDVQYRGKWHLSKGAVDENSLTAAEVGLYGFMGWTPPDAGEDSKNVNFGGGYANHDFNYINQAIDYIKNYEEQRKIKEMRGEKVKPFCLVLSLVNPHDVLAYPNNFEFGYESKDLIGDIQLPESWDENLLTNYKPEAQNQLKAVMNATLGGLPFVSQKKKYLNFYGNLLKKIDGEIGRLLDLFYDPPTTTSDASSKNQEKRNPKELANNTWIMRTSDHGELGMAHGGLRQKAFNIYEETLLVPLVFSNPVQFPEGQVSEELTGLVDVMPTVASLLNMDQYMPKGLRGQDMSPVILGTASDPSSSYHSKEGVLFTFDDVKAGSPDNVSSVDAPNRIRCVRTKDFKYARYFIAEGTYADEFEMYDLKNDPYELENVGNPRHPRYEDYAKDRDELQKLLETLEKEKMRVPPMRVRVAKEASESDFVPKSTPIFTEKGAAYQIGTYYVTGYPTSQGFTAAQNLSVSTVINLTQRSSPEIEGITFINIPVATQNQADFDAQMTEVIASMSNSPLPILIYDQDSDLAGAAWAAYLQKKEGKDTFQAIEKGMQVGLRHPETISALQNFLKQ